MDVIVLIAGTYIKGDFVEIIPLPYTIYEKMDENTFSMAKEYFLSLPETQRALNVLRQKGWADDFHLEGSFGIVMDPAGPGYPEGYFNKHYAIIFGVPVLKQDSSRISQIIIGSDGYLNYVWGVSWKVYSSDSAVIDYLFEVVEGKIYEEITPANRLRMLLSPLHPIVACWLACMAACEAGCYYENWDNWEDIADCVNGCVISCSILCGLSGLFRLLPR